MCVRSVFHVNCIQLIPHMLWSTVVGQFLNNFVFLTVRRLLVQVEACRPTEEKARLYTRSRGATVYLQTTIANDCVCISM